MFKNRPVFTSIIISVVFFLLGIGAEKLMEKKHEPVYSVINNPSLIYDSESTSSKIKLVLEDSIPVKDNVYVTTLAIWNKGKEAIEKEDLRKDFFIYCSDSFSHILDFRLLQENEPGISNFKLTPIGDSLKIEWDHFDPTYGLKVQIIYTGEKNTHIVATGSVLGADLRQVALKRHTPIYGLVILALVEIFLIALVLWIIISLFKDTVKQESKSRKGMKYLFPVIVTLFLIFIAGLLIYVGIVPFLGNIVPF